MGVAYTVVLAPHARRCQLHRGVPINVGISRARSPHPADSDVNLAPSLPNKLFVCWESIHRITNIVPGVTKIVNIVDINSLFSPSCVGPCGPADVIGLAAGLVDPVSCCG